MKKFLILTMTVILGLMLTGCGKVEPTNLDYKYKVTVKGSVSFDNGNGASGFEVALTITGAPAASYHVVTDNSGNFNIIIPCLGKDGIAVVASIKDFVYMGKKYSSKSSASGTAKAGESVSLTLTLNEGTAI